jgi:hypothetical protein
VRGILRGEGWVVSEALPQAQAAVKRAHANMGIGVPSYVEVILLHKLLYIYITSMILS